VGETDLPGKSDNVVGTSTFVTPIKDLLPSEVSDALGDPSQSTRFCSRAARAWARGGLGEEEFCDVGTHNTCSVAVGTHNVSKHAVKHISLIPVLPHHPCQKGIVGPTNQWWWWGRRWGAQCHTQIVGAAGNSPWRRLNTFIFGPLSSLNAIAWRHVVPPVLASIGLGCVVVVLKNVQILAI